MNQTFLFITLALLTALAVPGSKSHIHKDWLESSIAKKAITSGFQSFLANSIFNGTHTGYINVRDNDKDSLFYWFIPYGTVFEEKVSEFSLDNDAPLILWLTGGPGCSSMLAALTENGPFSIDENNTPVVNKYSWHTLGNLIYIDQPIGTGFSTINKDADIPNDEDQVSKDLATFFEKFLEKYPSMVNKKFYVTGESYAGHYIPNFGNYLLNNPVKGLDFQGVAVGNGWIDPVAQYPQYTEYGLDVGILSPSDYQKSKKMSEACTASISILPSAISFMLCNLYTQSVIGDLNPYDYTLDCEAKPLCYDFSKETDFLNDKSVEKELDVRKAWSDCSQQVYIHFAGDDWMKDFEFGLVNLAKAGKKVLLYNGDLDIICNWFGGEAVAKLVYKGAFNADYPEKLTPINGSDNKAIGEYASKGSFTFIRVYDAGHLVPMDKPAEAHQILEKFLLNKTVNRMHHFMMTEI